MDMRKEIRYRLEAPAIFTWENFQHKRLQGEGVTRDISLLGAFILSATCPPNLTTVRVEVALPSVIGIEADIRIIGEAQVVRVEHCYGDLGENGFALVPSDLNNWRLLTHQNEPVRHRESVADQTMHVA
jgi:hypothetical protein